MEGLSQGAIDCFLKLRWVHGSSSEVPKSSTCLLTWIQEHPQPPSWPNASAMYGYVRKMPGPPCWKVENITLDEAPLEPQTFYWCDHTCISSPCLPRAQLS